MTGTLTTHNLCSKWMLRVPDGYTRLSRMIAAEQWYESVHSQYSHSHQSYNHAKFVSSECSVQKSAARSAGCLHAGKKLVQ